MNKLLLPLVAVGGAAAQAITALPQLNNAAVFAAVNTNDPEYELCTLANNYLELCISSLGGNEGLATASPDELLGCACCISSTALSEAFSTCSSYLSAEEPTLSSEYQAYGTLYSACSMTSCGGASRPSSTAEGKDETITTSLSASGFASGSASASASGALSSITQSASLDDTVEPACTDMIGLYQSCLDKDTGFSTWAYQDQAACYCCRAKSGTLAWTDELDGYAKTCSSWAETADESGTIFSAASTFATFCDRFSDACTGTATSDPPRTTAPPSGGSSSNGDSGADDGGDNGGNNVTTVTVPGSGSAVRAGCAAGLAVMVGAVLLL